MSSPAGSAGGTGRVVAARTAARRLDARSWGGAMLCMTAAVTLLWIIQIVNSVDGSALNRYGLRPRSVHGLEGIVTMPFLHANAVHLLANTFPIVIIGTMALVHNVRAFCLATLIIIVGGGLFTWLIGPSGVVVGASALVFGWLGYLLARAYFARRLTWILGAAFALFMFGGLFAGLVPTVHSGVAWQAHVGGFLAGVFAGWLLHPRKGTTRTLRRSRTQ